MNKIQKYILVGFLLITLFFIGVFMFQNLKTKDETQEITNSEIDKIDKNFSLSSEKNKPGNYFSEESLIEVPELVKDSISTSFQK